MITETELEPREKALACTVVSLVPWDIEEFKPGLIPGRFVIPKSDTKTPAILHVVKSIHYVYLDDTRGSLQARDPSDEVAKSIVNDFVSGQLVLDENASPGIFWIPGFLELDEVLEKYKVEITRQKIRQNRWFLNIARMADDDWTRYHKHNVISDFQRTAALLIGWNPDSHEWMRAEIKEKENVKLCIACNSPLPGDPIMCPTCKCILKPEEWKKLEFAK